MTKSQKNYKLGLKKESITVPWNLKGAISCICITRYDIGHVHTFCILYTLSITLQKSNNLLVKMLRKIWLLDWMCIVNSKHSFKAMLMVNVYSILLNVFKNLMNNKLIGNVGKRFWIWQQLYERATPDFHPGFWASY